MSPGTFVMREKPAFGSPCNSCGVCCVREQCVLSVEMFGAHDLCPALGHGRDNELVCGLVRRPSEFLPDLSASSAAVMGEVFGLLIGAGAGCDGQTADEDEEAADAVRPLVMARAFAAIESAPPHVRLMLDHIRAQPGQAA